MPFFHFDQNNSGGSYDADENVAPLVIIEAVDDDAANDKAEEIGIYFNGVEDERDCECCGDRWWRVEGKGESSPNQSDIFNHRGKIENSPSVHIYYADGRKESY